MTLDLGLKFLSSCGLIIVDLPFALCAMREIKVSKFWVVILRDPGYQGNKMEAATFM